MKIYKNIMIPFLLGFALLQASGLYASCNHKVKNDPVFTWNYCSVGYRIYTKYVESPVYDGGCKSSANCCKNCTTERKQQAYRYRDYSTDGPSCNDSNWETDRVLVRSGTYDLVWFIGHVSDCDPATSPGCQPAD